MYNFAVFMWTQSLTPLSGSHVTGNATRDHVTGGAPEVTSFDRKLLGSACRRLKTRVLGVFQLLQGCNLQEVAVT